MVLPDRVGLPAGMAPPWARGPAWLGAAWGYPCHGLQEARGDPPGVAEKRGASEKGG